MQITTSLPFKSKWNTLKTKLIKSTTQKRRRSSSLDEEYQKRRKNSDTLSVGTLDSTASVAGRFRQALPFFRRRSSLSPPNSFDFEKEFKRLQSLYSLAVDELNYAEDSHGSSYYSGDLATARNALDECANCFLYIIQRVQNVHTREHIQATMAPKLFQLQSRIEALPAEDD
ncbi:hypothetical protein K501DRAFT_239420 [Backusella circina FSU 941]|nr:hypothetical protein K501DRAFT_239420 [Backusella circina FSU 941]